MTSVERSAWTQIKEEYYLTGNVDAMLKLRGALYDEINPEAAQPRKNSVFTDKSDELRARAQAASFFLLMLEKQKAVNVLAPYVDAKAYQQRGEVQADEIKIKKLEKDVYGNRLDVLAVGPFLTSVSSFIYRCHLRKHQMALGFAERAHKLFEAMADHYAPSTPLHLPFLLARYDNELQLALCEWRDEKKIDHAKNRLEHILDVLTIEYEKYLESDEAKIGSLQVLLAQVLGTLGDREAAMANLPQAKARIYRSMHMLSGHSTGGVSVGGCQDTCRRAYAYVLCARVEASQTTTRYAHAIALTKHAERLFRELADFLQEGAHEWITRARLQRLQCYVKAENRPQEVEHLLTEFTDKKEIDAIQDLEEREYAHGQLALVHTWLCERAAEQAPETEREQSWRTCLEAARKIRGSKRIPRRLEREGLLHEGRAKLNLAASIFAQKGREHEHQKLENEGIALIEDALTEANERRRPKLAAAAWLALAQGLSVSRPVKAAEALLEARKILQSTKNTYLEKQLEKLLLRPPMPEEGTVMISLIGGYDKVELTVKAAWVDYYDKLANHKPAAVEAMTGTDEKRFRRYRDEINKIRGQE